MKSTPFNGPPPPPPILPTQPIVSALKRGGGRPDLSRLDPRFAPGPPRVTIVSPTPSPVERAPVPDPFASIDADKRSDDG
jgi:hypothetical protein